MPRDTGAPDAPLSPFAHRLEVLKRYRRRANGEKRKAKALTAKRIQVIERLLAEIIDGADYLADVTLCDAYDKRPGVALFVTISKYHFNDLCEIGAEIEDDEENGDDEPSWGGGLVSTGWGCIDNAEREPSLGSCDAVMDQTRWSSGTSLEDDKDEEPSLGSCDGIIDQTRWHEGYHHGDNESERLNGADVRDSADDEPDMDDEPDEHRWPVPTEAGGAP